MISIDGNTLLPFDSQLYLYDAVGFMIGTASSIDLVSYLEVLRFCSLTTSSSFIIVTATTSHTCRKRDTRARIVQT